MNTTFPTMDVLDEHGLKLRQPRNGYRFSADALLLARFASIPVGGKVIDLGCGCGVIALLLAKRPEVRQVVGLELQTELAELARENARVNRLEHKVSIIQGDLRQISSLFSQHEFDALVANPPYWPVEAGRLNPNSGKALARHELRGDMQQYLKASAYLVRPRGKISLIYPAQRLAELWDGLHRYQLQPKRLKLIHPAPQAEASLTEASLFLLLASPQARPGLRVLPPEYMSGNEDDPV